MAADSQKNIPEPATPPSNEPPGAADQKPDTGGAHASGAQGGAVASKEERHTPPPPPRRTRKFLGRLAWICVILYFLGAGLWLGSKYFLFPFIEEQKPEIERTISEILQVPLKFDNLHVDWSGLSPEFSVSNIRLGSKGEGLLTADSLSGKISLQSLTGLEPSFESLTLRNPKLTVRRTGPLTFSIFGAGFNLGNISTSSVGVEGHLKKLPEDILLLLKQKKLEVTGGEVRYIDGQSGQSITIKDLNALWEKDGSNRKFAFTLTPPPEIALPITIRGVLKPSKADPSAVSDWNADLYANTEFINFGELAKWMPDFNVKYKGIGTGSLWTSLEKWSPVSASFIGALSDVNLKIPDPDLKPLALRYLKGKISASLNQKQFDISTEDFTFELESGDNAPPLSLALTLKRAADRKDASETPSQGFDLSTLDGGSLKANRIEFKGLSALVPSLPLPEKIKNFILARKLAGALEDVEVSWAGPPEHPKNYNGRLKIRNFASFGSSAKDDTTWLPGCINLSADVSLKDGTGEALLNTEKGEVALPGLFPAAAFPVGKLAGTLLWSSADGLRVTFKDVLVENDDLSVTVRGEYRTEPSGPGFADLTAELHRAQASAAWKYMPLVVGNETISWLRHSLLAGGASSGNAVLKGRLADFPFKGKTDELFKVSLNVQDIELDVYPNKFDNPKAASKKGAVWPTFTGVGGALEFEADSMRIRADKGSYGAVSLVKADVDIPAFSDETVRLTVDAKASGPLEDFLKYAKNSPVSGYTAGAFDKAEGSGDGVLTLGLDIPLAGPGAVKVNGSFALSNDSVKLNQYQVPELTGVSGTVFFSEHGAVADELTANCFGQSVNASLKVEGGDVTVTSSGTLDARALPQIVPIEKLASLSGKFITGAAPYELSVHVSDKGTVVEASSSLVGLASALPAPFTKAAALPAKLTFKLKEQAGTTDLSLMVNKFLASEFVLKGENVTRAAIGLKSLPSLPAEGYSIAITTPKVSLRDWQQAFESASPKTSAAAKEKSPAPFTLPDIAGARINIDLLEIDNFDQHNFALTSQTVGNSLTARVSSKELQASLEWKKGNGKQEPTLVARFSKLYIPESLDDAAENAKPVEISGGWPALNAVIDDLTYGKKHLGKVEITARNTAGPQGHFWQIQKLNVTNPDVTLRSSGSWAKTFDGKNETRLLLESNIGNLGGLLTRLSYPHLIRAGHGTVKGELSWDGTPLGFNTQSFDGSLNVNLSRGEILKIEPGAAAKLFSILTLQSLTRYLTLDFRDFYSSGFNFTSIQGKAAIDDGLMNLHDFTMTGGSATVVMNGDINMSKETQNLSLLILPDINAAGASVALAIANPIAGIGSLLAQLILKDPLSKLFSFEYKVTGSWSDPHVVKVERHMPGSAPAAESSGP